MAQYCSQSFMKNLQAVFDERGYVVAGEDGITYAATKNGDHDRSVQPGLKVAGDVRTKTLVSGGNRGI